MVIEDEYTVWYADGTNMMMVLMVIEDEYTVWYGANMMMVLSTNMLMVLMVIELRIYGDGMMVLMVLIC